MIACPQCGKEFAQAGNFCDACGSKLSAAIQEETIAATGASAEPKQTSGYVMSSQKSILDAATMPAKTTARTQPRTMQNQKSRGYRLGSSPFADDAALQSTPQVKAQSAQTHTAPSTTVHSASSKTPAAQTKSVYARQQKNYRTPLIVVSIVSVAIIALLAIMLTIKTNELEEALELNAAYQEALSASAKSSSSSLGTLSKNAAAANAAYQEIVSKLISEIKQNAGNSATTVLAQSNGSVTDINNDGTDEMMLIYSPDGKAIAASVYCTKSSGEVASITEDLGTIEQDQFAGVYSGTLDQSAVVCLVATTVKDDVYTCKGTFYTVESGNIAKLHEFSCTESSSESSYYIDNKKVTENVFNKYLYALTTGECFYGTDTPGDSLITLKNMLG